MLSQISKALASGFTSNQIVEYLLKKFPKHADKIKGALSAGFTTDQIVAFFSGGKKSLAKSPPPTTEFEEMRNKDTEAQAARNQKALQLGTLAGTSLGAPTAIRALQRALPTSLLGQAQNILSPQESIHPQQPPINVSNIQQPQQPIATNPQQPNISNVAQSQPQLQPKGNITAPNVRQIFDKSGLSKHVDKLAKDLNGNPEHIAGVLYQKFPKEMQALQKESGMKMEEAIEHYLKEAGVSPEKAEMNPMTPKQPKQPEIGKNAPEIQPNNQIQTEKVPVLEKESKNALGLTPKKAKGLLDKLIAFDEPIYDKHFGKGFYRNKLMKMSEGERDQWLNENADKFTKEDMSKFQNFYKNWNPEHTIENLQNAMGSENNLTEKTENMHAEEKPKQIEKKQTVSTPEGIGEVKEIRGDKALVEIDGKVKKVDLDALEKEPEDLEHIVRTLMDKIPEKEKSTAIQTATHIDLPDGQTLMLTQFYDGKIAWYLDVPEEIYNEIALGTYEPKGQATTGIAEYKPGVIDSRGAGFSQEIRLNAKYAKNEKGKTWGYAKNKYDALKTIQPILEKMSKERYDENGNLIEPKKRKKPTS